MSLLTTFTCPASRAQEGPPPPPPPRPDVKATDQSAGPALFPATGQAIETVPERAPDHQHVSRREAAKPDLSAAPTGAWLGVDLVERFRNQAMVLRVHPGSPAERAGIRADDVILSVGREEVVSRDHLIDLIGQMQPGSDVEIQVDRDRRRRVMDAVLARRNTVAQPIEEIGPGFTVLDQQRQLSPEAWETQMPPPRQQRRGWLRPLFGRR